MGRGDIIGKMTDARLSADARAIFLAALAAVDPEAAVTRALRLDGDRLDAGELAFDLSAVRGLRVLALGKAAVPMARGALAVLGHRLAGGLCVTSDPPIAALAPLEVRVGSHPVPDARSVAAGEAALREVRGCARGDLLLVLLSGGTSSLMESPLVPISLDDLAALHGRLLRSGAPIGEMNAVRAALSAVKGGRLLLALPEGVQCVVLVVSDVLGSPLHVIGSGPFFPQVASASAAMRVLMARGLWEEAPDSVRRVLCEQVGGDDERARRLAERAPRAPHQVLADNRVMVEAAAGRARDMGYATMVLSTYVEGEAREAGALLAAVAREMRMNGRPLGAPACVLASGETTVTVRGEGRGGRCQEMALGFGLQADGLEGVQLLCGASDGIDGLTTAAGALADGRTRTRAQALGRDARQALWSNDSFPLFEALGDLLVTGPTGTNTNELYVLLVGSTTS